MSNELAVTEFPKASTALSLQLGLEPRVMIDALKSQFFKGKEATDAQLAVVVSIAKELRLNPLLPGQLYPYPDRTGAVTVMIGPDGIYTLLANNPDIVAQKDGGPAYWVEHGTDEKGAQTATGFINHKVKGLLKKTIWVDEWVVQSNPNWGSRRHHMAEIRALKQAARMVVHGIPADADEHKIGEMLNVTPENETVERPAPPKRSPKGAAAVKENKEVVVEQEAAPVTPEPTPVAPVAPEPVAPAAPEPAKVEEAAPAPEPAKPAPEAPKPAAPKRGAKAPVQRASLTDKEVVTVTVSVTEFKTREITKGGVTHQSVTAVVSGPEFKGEVHHLGGAKLIAPDKREALPEWQIEKPVLLTIHGEYSAKQNRVVTWVDAIALPVSSEGSAAGQQAEDDV